MLRDKNGETIKVWDRMEHIKCVHASEHAGWP